MCIVTALNQGIRNGGGLGDVLRYPSSKEPLYAARVVYDLLYFFVVIIIVLNLIFGVIIDTFADLRSEKTTKEEILNNTCFICDTSIDTVMAVVLVVVWASVESSKWLNCADVYTIDICLDRKEFDNKEVTFEDHISREHHVWDYLSFIVLLKVKDPTEFTGPESYVDQLIKTGNLEWFPRMQCMSLSEEDGETEQNDLRLLREQLKSTNALVEQLSDQLKDLKAKMNEQRKDLKRQRLLSMPTVSATSFSAG
ncbi:inositol 1,4,5-trisphosphate receptor type 2-like [Corticium candelabrum]|uniref:inositol 1,4,5-trisphosphate receptor type 2-like n=1 Tax=Corticium candelabrum TaxID=121492 RepID=UPI002E26BE05|nr:inositol 1,4,5-trisphosphate receptor type 2-like [Corticium candelabrum]